MEVVNMFNFFRKNVMKQQVKEQKGIMKAIDTINVKCAYGAKIQELNEVERVLYLNHIFQTEIQNGGFAMLFFHPAGAYAHDMVDTLRTIGAIRCAQLLEEAIAKFPVDIKRSSVEKRQDLLEEIDPNDDIFIELNEAMQSMGEPIDVYQKAYMLKHKEDLS